jgi:hypothetical protein
VLLVGCCLCNPSVQLGIPLSCCCFSVRTET